MAYDLNNKVAVVTGGAGGIGQGIAKKFIENGARVILLDINKEGINAAEELNKEYGANKATFFKCDVTKDLESSVPKIFGLHKTVDCLINSFGILEERNVKAALDVNLQAVIDWSFKFWDHMRMDKNGKGGLIINLSSIYGVRANPLLPIYHAAKHGVVGFSKSLGHAFNFERSRVRVVALCPGLTETNFGDNPNFWDDSLTIKDFDKILQTLSSQSVDVVGETAVQIYKTTNSGSTWIIEGSQLTVREQNEN